MGSKFTWFPKLTDTLQELAADFPEQVGEFALAITQYGTYGIEPEIDNIALKYAFLGIKEDIDNSVNARYRNKGGRPSKTAEVTGVNDQETPVTENETGVSDNETPSTVNHTKPIHTNPSHTNTGEKKRAPKEKFGQFQNVLLTASEADKLRKEYPDKWESYVESLSAYMASKGKSYKSHYATILNWMRKDEPKGGTKHDEYSDL